MTNNDAQHPLDEIHARLKAGRASEIRSHIRRLQLSIAQAQNLLTVLEGTSHDDLPTAIEQVEAHVEALVDLASFAKTEPIAPVGLHLALTDIEIANCVLSHFILVHTQIQMTGR
ncbi:MAG: hypothetical protein P0Y66_14830 [Candidatus Kaistia colombiensis]|nr:MAG: hypothetical protein P0Y66_14830 [Kaistia sp.]